MLKVENLHKSFGSRPVLQDLSLRVRPGHLSVLIGRSGCGKSTLLRCPTAWRALDPAPSISQASSSNTPVPKASKP